jgi:hypothetical protein
MNFPSKLLGLIFIISSFMPWVGIPEFDSQPFPVIFCVLFLLLNYQNLPKLLADHKYIMVLFLIIISALLLCVINNYSLSFDFLLIRGLYNYLGFAMLITGYLLYFKIYKFPVLTLLIINLLWILVGVVQIFHPSIVSDFVAYRTTEGRGMPSLAPEPTFFGIFLFFISWIYLIRSDYKINLKVKLIIFVNFLSVLFLAKSSLIILYLSIVFFLYFILRCKIKYKLFIIFFTGILLLLLNYIDFDTVSSRIAYFIKVFYSNPLLFFSSDESANQRLSNIVLPIHGLIYNYFVPGGFYSYSNVVNEIIPFYDEFFFYSYDDSKIMSWLGAMVYELGFFGIIIIYIIMIYSYNGSNRRFLEILILLILLASAIPIAFPLVPFIFALFLYKNSNTKLKS